MKWFQGFTCSLTCERLPYRPMVKAHNRWEARELIRKLVKCYTNQRFAVYAIREL